MNLSSYFKLFISHALILIDCQDFHEHSWHVILHKNCWSFIDWNLHDFDEWWDKKDHEIFANKPFSVIYVGCKVFKTFSIWMVDILTWKSCTFESSHFYNSTGSLIIPNCADKLSSKLCSDAGGTCEIIIDGFYIEVAFNVVLGIFWYFWARKVAKKLQNLPLSDWHVLSNQNRVAEMQPLKNMQN